MEYPGHDTVLRDIVLRIYWENSPTPSVEVPLGDFFGLGHTLPPPFYEKLRYTVGSAPVTVGINERAMNCYWPMPFHKSARIEVFNNGEHTLRQIYYHVDYELGAQPTDAGLFHALFRQEKEVQAQDWINLDGKENYVLLETEGRGHYVGCFMYIDATAGGWWGEGDDMIFIDHDPMPTINGTGTEDYFNNAWCYHHSFSFPYFGCPLLEKRSDGGSYVTLYRMHVPDPIRFSNHIKVTMEHCWDKGRTNSYTTVAFWYQDKPVSSRPALPAGKANHSLRHGEPGQQSSAYPEVAVPLLEIPLRKNGISVRSVMVIGQEWLRGGALSIDTEGREVEIPIAVPQDGIYRVEVKPVYALIDDTMTLRAGNGTPVKVKKQTFKREDDGPFLNLGEAVAQAGELKLLVSGNPTAPIHQIRLRKLD